MARGSTLTERKQQKTRETIIRTAYELFAQRGFTAVTVDDIAARAEVGRTTFFRYFGDKQEVVFYDEPQMLELAGPPPDERDAALDVHSALAQLRPIALALCDQAVRDPVRYGIHSRLVDANPELHERDLRKLQGYAEQFERMLLTRGASTDVALLAAHVALACYHASRRLTQDDPSDLPRAVAAAFDAIIAERTPTVPDVP